METSMESPDVIFERVLRQTTDELRQEMASSEERLLVGLANLRQELTSQQAAALAEATAAQQRAGALEEAVRCLRQDVFAKQSEEVCFLGEQLGRTTKHFEGKVDDVIKAVEAHVDQLRQEIALDRSERLLQQCLQPGDSNLTPPQPVGKAAGDALENNLVVVRDLLQDTRGSSTAPASPSPSTPCRPEAEAAAEGGAAPTELGDELALWEARAPAERRPISPALPDISAMPRTDTPLKGTQGKQHIEALRELLQDASHWEIKRRT
jgi:hypothetical protein